MAKVERGPEPPDAMCGAAFSLLRLLQLTSQIQALETLLCPLAGRQWAWALELGLGLDTALLLPELCDVKHVT